MVTDFIIFSTWIVHNGLKSSKFIDTWPTNGVNWDATTYFHRHFGSTLVQARTKRVFREIMQRPFVAKVAVSSEKTNVNIWSLECWTHIFGLYFLSASSVVVICGFRRILEKTEARTGMKLVDENSSELWILNPPVLWQGNTRLKFVSIVKVFIFESAVWSLHWDEIVLYSRKSGETLKGNKVLSRKAKTMLTILTASD